MQGGGYHPFVTVTVEGKKCRFLIDTGASKSVIDKHFYESKLERKMKVLKQETTGLHSTVMESYTGTLKKLQIGELNISQYFVAGVDLSHVNSTYKKMKIKKIDGILGSDLLKIHNVVIDYAQSMLFIGGRVPTPPKRA
ncbi:MAG: putative aspartyl protease [Bacteroidetes bacterium]|nr:putative aspartyl protease [Bacteroidota bacterium]